MTARALLERDRSAAATSAVRRRPTSIDARNSTSMLLQLQRSAGNAAVARSLSASVARPGLIPVVQRCGPVPCNCTNDERAEYEAEHSDSGQDHADGKQPEDPAVQRVATCHSRPLGFVRHRNKMRRYSITSSARASSVGGTARPSALAVLRLTTSSNFVGCITGRLAGFSPFRIRPA